MNSMNDILQEQPRSANTAVDLVKFIMAVLVVGIHTEPFSFNIWLDRGFGIITRLCLPFFFIAGAYFFFRGGKPLKKYLWRLTVLYFVWSFIYLPFDFSELREMSVLSIIERFFWGGNGHALWYLQGTIIGTLIVCLFIRICGEKATMGISFFLLAIGVFFSTYAPVAEKIGGVLLYR